MTSPIQTTRQAQTHTDERPLDKRCTVYLTQTTSGRDKQRLNGYRRTTTLQHWTVIIRHAFRDAFFSLFFQLFLFLDISIIRIPVKTICQRGCSSIDATMTLEDELTTAAAKGNAADVENLLRAGAQVNGVNSFGRTALQVSVNRCAFSNFCGR